jgi:hypothetical protein
MEDLKVAISNIEQDKSKSKHYMAALRLESDLKNFMKPLIDHIPDDLYI